MAARLNYQELRSKIMRRRARDYGRFHLDAGLATGAVSPENNRGPIPLASKRRAYQKFEKGNS
jgi:hypothetical protein